MKFLLVILALGAAFRAEAQHAFSAAEYFETIYPGQRRNPGLPARVNFETIEIDQPEFEELLPGQWIVRSTCSGRPLHLGEVMYSPYGNGVTTPSITVNFYNDGKFERVTTRGTQQAYGELRVVDQSGRWSLGRDNEDGPVYVRFAGTEIQPLRLNIVRVKETGEVIFANPLPVDNATIRCGAGEIPYALFLKIPLS